MAEVIEFTPGGYRYIKGVFQYSAGVSALPGYAIERVRLTESVPLAEGFSLIETHLASLGRPTTAFCACELRSPEPFSEQGFVDFNRHYVGALERWGLFTDETNPVARTNVCPEYAKPAVPSLHAFSYTIPMETDRGSFIIAGGGEASEGVGPYQNTIVRLGDLSPEALVEKVRFVMAAMEGRLSALGFGWSDALSVQAYTVHDIGFLIAQEIISQSAPTAGIVWNFSRPPVVNIEYEMDVRGAFREIAL